MLGLVVLFVALMSIVGQFYKHVLGHDYLLGFVPLFDFNGERNIPTWYSSSMLLLCSVLLAIIAASTARSGDRYQMHWKVLSATFLIMSADEVIQIHEQMINPLRAVLDLGGVFHYAWSVVGLALVLAFVLAYPRFIAHLPTRTRRLFIVAAGLYVGGALGMELVQGWHDGLYGVDGVTALITTVEEVLEMSGVVVFVYALLSYMSVIQVYAKDADANGLHG
ncbi:MAG: hypothetical protein WKF95_04145 [Rubrobacter sp.]